MQVARKKRKKMTGKGHTLYEDQLPEHPEDIWLLVAESCYEISRTLLAEGSYANSISFSVSGYDRHSARGGFNLTPEGHLRYPMELYRTLWDEPRSHSLITTLLGEIRRLLVRVECRPWVVPLFHEEGKTAKTFSLLEKVRKKNGAPDVIGMGLEGLRYRRIGTYTPKRSDEIRRALSLLEGRPELMELLKRLELPGYWHRRY